MRVVAVIILVFFMSTEAYSQLVSGEYVDIKHLSNDVSDLRKLSAIMIEPYKSTFTDRINNCKVVDMNYKALSYRKDGSKIVGVLSVKFDCINEHDNDKIFYFINDYYHTRTTAYFTADTFFFNRNGTRPFIAVIQNVDSVKVKQLGFEKEYTLRWAWAGNMMKANCGIIPCRYMKLVFCEKDVCELIMDVESYCPQNTKAKSVTVKLSDK